jgi:predicted RNA-binding Zn ribbon-like protein
MMTGAALLLRDFVNTLDLECGLDDFATPVKLAGWLREHGLLLEPGLADAADLTMAIMLREGLRTAMLDHHRPGTSPRALSAELEGSLARLPLRVSLATPRPTLTPTAGGMAGALGRVASAIMESAAEGTWERLKACQEDTCQWAFVDTSKNRSRAWCSMRVCGNRTKTRAYRARRRATAGGDL